MLALGKYTVTFIGIFLILSSCADSEMKGSSSRKVNAGNIIPTPESDDSIPGATPEAQPPVPTPVPKSEETIDTGDGDLTGRCGEYKIPAAEFDGLDGSANAFLSGGNQAYIDWSRCPKQITDATVDNGGIRINFKNPPAAGGKLVLTVKTTHARIYRVGYAADIKGAGLPTRYTHNSTYVYECEYNNAIYACVMK